MPEELLTEVEGNGSEPSKYEELLRDLQEKGHFIDGDKIASQGGLQLLASSPQRQAAVHYLATVARAADIYKKDDILAALLDQMARTVFVNREERIAFLNYLEWVKEFEQDYDYAFWWVVGAISEGGQSRIDLVAAVTTINQNQRLFHNGQGKFNKRDSTKPGITG